MALAVTHVILTIIVLSIFRHYIIGRKDFPTYLVLAGGIAGLMPDIDILFGWVYNLVYHTDISFHGGPTHSVIIPVALAIAAMFLHFDKKIVLAKIFYVVSFGWFFHLCLDCIFGGYKYYLWPLAMFNFCPQFGISSYAVEIDAVLLIMWLVHEEVHHQIKNYF